MGVCIHQHSPWTDIAQAIDFSVKSKYFTCLDVEIAYDYVVIIWFFWPYSK
jgi:hypothetical protein